MSFDIYVFQLLGSLADKNWILDALFIFFAKYAVYFLFLLAIFIGWRMDNWRKKIYFFLLSLTSLIVSRGIVVEILKYAFQRQRPADYFQLEEVIVHGSSFAFPSGHTAFLFALSFSFWFFNKKWAWTFAGLSLLVGLSRIVTGAHWPTDIIFAILIGAITPFVLEIFFFNKAKKEKSPSVNSTEGD